MPKPKGGLPKTPVEDTLDTAPHPLTLAAQHEDLTPVEQPIPQPKKPTNPKKQAVTIHIDAEVIERARNAVYWTPGLTLAELAERALRGEIEALEVLRGEAFPQRSKELQTGRPVGR